MPATIQRIGMRAVDDEFVGPRQHCPHGFKLGSDGKGRGCNMCQTGMADEFISRRRARRNPGLGMPVLGVVVGLGFTAIQGDTDTPSLLVGAVAGGLLGLFVSSIKLGDEEEEAAANPGPAAGVGIAAAGELAKGAYKAAIRGVIKKQTDEISRLSQQLSEQVKAADLDDDDDDEAKPNPVPWVRGLVVVGGTCAALWGLKRLEVI